MRPCSFMWSSTALFSQPSTIFCCLYLIMKDRKASRDIQLTHIEVHTFLKLVGLSFSSVFSVQIFFGGAKSNADAKIIFLKHVGKTTFCYGKILFTLRPKRTRFLVEPKMGVTFYLIHLI